MLRHHLFLGLTVLLLAVGCAEADPTRQVEGKVTYQGKLLEHGLLSFFPDGARPVNASISTSGTYQVQLLPGDYQVIVNAPPKLPDDFKEGDPLPPPDPNALPVKYSRQQSSGLTATVQMQEGPQTLDFELK
ncbi:hypothetical protein [Bythopirellula goksoeyrii]|uniref:Carboxypeptidase regulatory-like domain-containing protein n=1 Tax=Bythopirellula goksoeyrii TaxID=1400387 RepID=A0A5B9QJ36_9BACT|nr:hypothetical protein [Bythopirellula goksoeyrii]QEG37545.1 hypothetical protein Pr1d_48910 [Bythopirellula goksoeyrii]